MKNFGKILIWLVIIVLVGLLAATYLYDHTSDLSTFWESAGVVFVDDVDSYRKGDNYVLKGKGEDGADITATVQYVSYEDSYIVLDHREINKVYVDAYKIKGYMDKQLKVEANFNRADYEFDVIKMLQACGLKLEASDPNQGSFWSDMLMPIMTLGIGIFIIVLFIRQAKGANSGAMDFGKTKAQVITNIKVRFSDVAGAEEEKQELQEVVEFLKNPQKFTALGARTPKGVLLVGNPGTGKTLFAKAVAGEASVPFFSISGSDFVEMFVGVGASRVRDLFNTAKKNQPCIIFIDEIDAVGRQRGAGLGGGNDEREQTLNQILVQMDGFESSDGIIVMAATNRADVLDPALIRPGRFDRTIYVNMPDVKGREAILKVHARNKPLAPDVNFKVLARMTGGFSGADLANLLNEAAILAARQNRKFLTNEDLYEGINKVLLGPQKRSRIVTETDKRITAYHESGHAILAGLLPGCDPVHEVSIIPRGAAGGYTMTRPDNDDAYLAKSRLLDDLVMTMGGRAAEEIVIHEVTSGPSADITHVTKIAKRMVTEWGMSERLGPVCYGSGTEIFLGRDYQTKADYSEETAKLIDSEVQRIINESYKKAVELLTANKNLLDTMARVLIERETIYTDEVRMIMDGKSAQEVMDAMDSKDKSSGSNPFSRMESSLNKSDDDGLVKPDGTLNH
ncbi:MAG: ATP-dependent zinc metalloprotease FtsH [Clostridia bacterium]|nr:ATP-dependent zinc metalloprotease FtsH [Clostridia bacterium]